MVKFRDLISKITFTSVSLAVIFLLVLLQIIFYIGSFIWVDLGAYKFGPAFYMIAAGGALFFIIKFIGKKGETIDRRDVLYLLLVLGAVIAFFILTKKYLPQMFSLAVPPQFQGTELFQFTKS